MFIDEKEHSIISQKKEMIIKINNKELEIFRVQKSLTFGIGQIQEF
jgi:hypothetical protein